MRAKDHDNWTLISCLLESVC